MVRQATVPTSIPNHQPAHQATLPKLGQVATDNANTDLGSVLSAIHQWLGTELAELDAYLADPSHYAQPAGSSDWGTCATFECSRYITNIGGKRLRPLVALLAQRLFDDANSPCVYDYAVAAELVHTATLLHDDVLDEGTLRRGKPSTNVVYGNAVSVLAGDHLLVRAIRLVQPHHPEVLTNLCQALDEMVSSEALQLEMRGKFRTDRAIYDEIVDGKTAALFRWAFMAGGAAANCSAEAQIILKKLGTGIGMAYQIVDDILDLSSDAETLGKRTFADIQDGKLTLPLLYACEADAQNHIVLARLCGIESPSSEDIDAIQRMLGQSQAIELARGDALEIIENMYELLGYFPASESRTHLRAICSALENRIC